MRYNSQINNVKANEWGLNIQLAYLFSWFYELPSWAESVTIEGESYYFASKNKAVNELPLLTDKPDTMYRYYKKLENLDLVNIKKIDGKDYVNLTSKSKEWNSSLGRESDNSENNPNALGKESETNSDLNPTYNNYNNYNKTTYTKTKPETSNEDFSEDFNLDDSSKTLKKEKTKKVALKKVKQWDEDVLNCHQAILKLFPSHLQPKSGKIEEEWIDTIDKLKRIDHVPLIRVYEIMKSVLEDDFWKGVVLSVTKLRAKNKEKISYIVVFNEKFPNGKNKQDAKIEAQKAAYLANSNPNDLM